MKNPVLQKVFHLIVLVSTGTTLHNRKQTFYLLLKYRLGTFWYEPSFGKLIFLKICSLTNLESCQDLVMAATET